jgi:hypothetical protein
MKKFIITAAALLIILSGLFFFRNYFHPEKVHTARCGSKAKNIVLGMKGQKLYNLNDFIGKNIIILSFSDNSAHSGKFEKEFPKNIGAFLMNRDILWLDIKKDGSYAVIRDLTGSTDLNYRCSYSDIPAFYTFPDFPSVIIIGKNSTIGFVYIGYSPTMFNDVRDWIGKIKTNR